MSPARCKINGFLKTQQYNLPTAISETGSERSIKDPWPNVTGTLQNKRLLENTTGQSSNNNIGNRVGAVNKGPLAECHRHAAK